MISIKLDEFTDTKSLDKMAELYEVLNEERLSAKDTGISYRVISHWDKKGIIRFSRNNADSNRKFSFVDFVWIKVVNELRAFGVKLPVIEKIASDIYEPLPMTEVLDNLAGKLDVIDTYEGEEKEDFKEFLRSGEYKAVDFDPADINFTYLHLLISEALVTRSFVTLIVFNDGEWFPFIKNNEHLYSEKLLYKMESFSQVRVNITELIFRYLFEDYFTELCEGLHVFSILERRLIYHIKEGDYKKVFVLFKSKKHEPVEIVKSKTAPEEIMRILREKEYREFILIDTKNNEFRIKEGEEPEKQVEEPIIIEKWADRKKRLEKERERDRQEMEKAWEKKKAEIIKNETENSKEGL